MIEETVHHWCHLTEVLHSCQHFMPEIYRIVSTPAFFISSMRTICNFMFHFHFTDSMNIYLSWANMLLQYNFLTLNVSKTEEIIIGFYFYINQLPQIETEGVRFGKTLIKFLKSLRSLSVLLDQKLNWKEQVSNTCRKAFLAESSEFLPPEYCFRVTARPR